jgi:hypothetical protein
MTVVAEARCLCVASATHTSKISTPPFNALSYDKALGLFNKHFIHGMSDNTVIPWITCLLKKPVLSLYQRSTNDVVRHRRCVHRQDDWRVTAVDR